MRSSAPDSWHTAGTRILDAQGRMVRIAGVTWYGMESAYWVPAGLDFQRYTTIMDEVRLLGYNTIRLPFSNELVERNPVIRGWVAANPNLHGKHALDVLDDIVRYAQTLGLKIILDNHRSRAARPLDVNTLDEPLWYTHRYPESSWVHDWQTLARRYLHDDAVVGFDLRNEPHTGGAGPWTVSTYLHQGATWGPYHGVENRATDWRLAAERAGDAILAINPRLLIFVDGIQLYPNRRAPNGVDSSWWSGLLTPVKHYPVRLRVAHRLVYSVHEWGPRKYQMPWFQHMSDATLRKVWHDNWAFIRDHPEAQYAAPIWLGEFGTCTTGASCAMGAANQEKWFTILLGYLRDNPAMGWTFFALDGTNSNNCKTDNGLLNSAWNNVSNRGMQARLASIGAAALPATGSNDPAPLIPGTETGRKPRDPRSRLCLLP